MPILTKIAKMKIFDDGRGHIEIAKTQFWEVLRPKKNRPQRLSWGFISQSLAGRPSAVMERTDAHTHALLLPGNGPKSSASSIKPSHAR